MPKKNITPSLILGISIIFVTGCQSLPSRGENACKSYLTECSSSDQRKQCVEDAANKAKDQDCLDYLAYKARKQDRRDRNN